MRPGKKTSVFLFLLTSIFAGVQATRLPASEIHPKRNLKVIPASISDEDLDVVMALFSRDLGVNCTYCHVSTKEGIVPKRADFASDEKIEKGIARKMMRMTDRINKKYFLFENNYGFQPGPGAPITCRTCHRGLMRPVNIPLIWRNP